jgi:hypothetical protein
VAQSFPDGTFTGVSCKVWIQQVVYQASAKVVWLPTNSSTDWMWQWSFDVEALATDRWDGVDWPSGCIIQAQVRTATGGVLPHTFIIVSVDRFGATFIECNWKGDSRVRRRTESWLTLQRQIVHYTLYRVK